MRRFLLLALGMGFLLPTGVNAETWYLLVKHSEGAARNYSWTVPMESEAACNEENTKVVQPQNWRA